MTTETKIMTLRLGLDIVATAVGVSSTVFMIFVFYNEAILHRGVLFIEPNLPIASFEFVFSVFGLLTMMVLFFVRLPQKENKAKEPYGYESVNGQYQGVS